MSKLLSILIAAAFATVSVGSFAASHGGAAKDAKPMEKKEEKKDMKGMSGMEGKKDMKGMSGMEGKKDEKKADKK